MAARQTTSPNHELLPPLAQHRLHNGVTLEEIADNTKISLRFLRAIEAEDFGQLPGGIFARSYLRQYAAAIGFDEDQLLSRYEAAFPDRRGDGPDIPRKPPASEKRKRSGREWFRAVSPIRFL